MRMNSKTVRNVLAMMAMVQAVLFGANAYAVDSARKYGVVDMQSVILAVEEGKTARAELEKQIKSKEGEFQKQKEELDKMNNEWKNQASILSEEARMNKQKEFQEKFLALRNAEMEFQQDIKRKEQKATQTIAIKVAGLVEKMAKEKKLEAVFETNSAGLLYLENPQDMTKEVIDRFGKESKTAKKE